MSKKKYFIKSEFNSYSKYPYFKINIKSQIEKKKLFETPILYRKFTILTQNE